MHDEIFSLEKNNNIPKKTEHPPPTGKFNSRANFSKIFLTSDLLKKPFQSHNRKVAQFGPHSRWVTPVWATRARRPFDPFKRRLRSVRVRKRFKIWQILIWSTKNDSWRSGDYQVARVSVLDDFLILRFVVEVLLIFDPRWLRNAWIMTFDFWPFSVNFSFNLNF